MTFTADLSSNCYQNYWGYQHLLGLSPSATGATNHRLSARQVILSSVIYLRTSSGPSSEMNKIIVPPSATRLLLCSGSVLPGTTQRYWATHGSYLRYCGYQPSGSLAGSYSAFVFFLMYGDPIANISATRDIQRVWIAGTEYEGVGTC